MKHVPLSVLSHELLTPMNAIIGMSDLLLRTALSDEQREYAEHVRNAGDHLLDLLTVILDVNDAESGRFVLARQKFDVRACVDACVARVAPDAERKGLRLRSAWAVHLPDFAIGDPPRVRRMLSQLLESAISSTAAGDVAIAVTGQTEGDRTAYTFTVSAAGIGHDGSAGRPTTPFGAAEESDATEGLNFGLALCQRLVRLMGGEFQELRAGPGQDPSVALSISLPSERRSPTRVQLDPATASRHPLTILVADDNPINRALLARLLQQMGYQPDVVTNGHDAVLAAQTHRYDVVLMDVQMPVLDGLEATRQIRGKAMGRPRVIAVTANAGPGDREACLNAGMDDYLAKPLRVDALLDALVQRTT